MLIGFLFTKLTKIVDMNYHPEATKFIKVTPENFKRIFNYLG